MNVGFGPVSVAVGFFNNDGDQDLAVANQGSNNVSVLLGDGTPFAPAINYPVGGAPTSVAVGDFNNNGDSDLVTTNLFSDNVSVLLGAGDGSFGAASGFGALVNPVSAAVGDFNNDTNQDLAVANESADNVSVLPGGGDGSFGAKTDFGVGNGPRSIAVGDFDNNGLEDLVTANHISDNLSVLARTRRAHALHPGDRQRERRRPDLRHRDTRRGLQSNRHDHLQGLRPRRHQLHGSGRLHRRRDGLGQRELHDHPGLHTHGARAPTAGSPPTPATPTTSR